MESVSAIPDLVWREDTLEEELCLFNADEPVHRPIWKRNRTDLCVRILTTSTESCVGDTCCQNVATACNTDRVHGRRAQGHTKMQHASKKRCAICRLPSDLCPANWT